MTSAKAATALAYLGQTLNQSVKIAQDEYANVFGGAVWRRKVASCLEPPPPALVPKPVSQPARPAHPPAPHSDSNPGNSDPTS